MLATRPGHLPRQTSGHPSPPPTVGLLEEGRFFGLGAYPSGGAVCELSVAWLDHRNQGSGTAWERLFHVFSEGSRIPASHSRKGGHPRRVPPVQPATWVPPSTRKERCGADLLTPTTPQAHPVNPLHSLPGLSKQCHAQNRRPPWRSPTAENAKNRLPPRKKGFRRDRGWGAGRRTCRAFELEAVELLVRRPSWRDGRRGSRSKGSRSGKLEKQGELDESSKKTILKSKNSARPAKNELDMFRCQLAFADSSQNLTWSTEGRFDGDSLETGIPRRNQRGLPFRARHLLPNQGYLKRILSSLH